MAQYFHTLEAEDCDALLCCTERMRPAKMLSIYFSLLAKRLREYAKLVNATILLKVKICKAVE